MQVGLRLKMDFGRYLTLGKDTPSSQSPVSARMLDLKRSDEGPRRRAPVPSP